MKDPITMSTLIAVGILTVMAPSLERGSAPATAELRSDTIVVNMIDKSATEYTFEPAEVTVRPGSVVRFVQTTTTPHNVEFRNMPDGTALNGDRMGPFLTRPGETYEVVIDERFAAGDHPFVCTPHEMMGMTGILTVEGG